MTGDLAQRRPFSDSAYIREHADRRTAARFERLAQQLGLTVSAAAAPFACGDPILRSLVTLLGERLERDGGLDGEARARAEQLVRSADAYANAGPAWNGLEPGDAVPYDAGGESGAIPLWRLRLGAGDESDLVPRLGTILARRAKSPQSLGDFTPAQAGTLAAALRLLGDTIPAVAASLLPHVRLLCRLATPAGADGFVPSGSFRDLPGIVFLADPVLTDPLDAAEAILHENCHQRYGELSHAASILADGYDEAHGAKILVPWHRPSAASSLWGVDKALTAAHVYLYQTYFYGTLLDTPAAGGECGPLETRRRFFSNLAHARFLLIALDGSGRAQLGYAGNLLLDWMLAAAAAFPVAEDGGARMTRLLLERWLEENHVFSRSAAARAGLAAWLEERDAEAARRFARIVGPDAGHDRGRRGREKAVRELLLLPPEELGRRTDHLAALAFAQRESADLDRLLDPAFRASR